MENEVTSVNISYTTPLGKKSSRAFTNVDPNASDKEIVDFSEAMNDLTTNTLTSTSKITKKEIDTSVTYYDSWIGINFDNNGKTPDNTQSAWLTKVADGVYNASLANMQTIEGNDNKICFQVFCDSTNNVKLDVPLINLEYYLDCPEPTGQLDSSYFPVMYPEVLTENTSGVKRYMMQMYFLRGVTDFPDGPGGQIIIKVQAGTYNKAGTTNNKYTINSSTLTINIVA